VSLYLDASAIIPTLTNQSMTQAAQSFLRRSAPPFFVSDLGESEVAAAVSRMVRMGNLAASQGRALLASFDIWLAVEATLVETSNADFRIAIGLVRRFELKLLTPDALHMAISERLSAQLVTFDQRLALAAQAIGLLVVTP
jgi:uncharacterized protein